MYQPSYSKININYSQTKNAPWNIDDDYHIGSASSHQLFQLLKICVDAKDAATLSPKNIVFVPGVFIVEHGVSARAKFREFLLKRSIGTKYKQSFILCILILLFPAFTESE